MAIDTPQKMTKSAMGNGNGLSPRAHRSLNLRVLFILLISLALFALATYLAFRQAPKPDVFAKSTLWDQLYYPREKNAFKRLPIINGVLNDLFVLPGSEKIWAVGENGLIIHSADGGRTWQQQAYPGSDALSQLYQQDTNSTFFEKPFSLLPQAYAAVREDRPVTPVEATATPQQSPKQVIQPQVPIANEQQQVEPARQAEAPASARDPSVRYGLNAIYFTDDNSGYIVGDRGLILKTTDGGQRWSRQDTTSYDNLNDIVADVRTKKVFAVGNNGSILSTSDGINWQKQGTRINAHLRSIDFTDNFDQGWVVGDSGTIIYSDNGGDDWQQQDAGVVWSLLSVKVLRQTNRPWAVGEYGSMLSFSEREDRWRVVSQLERNNLHGIDFSNSGEQIWVVGNDSILLNSTDSGRNWQSRVIENTIANTFKQVTFITPNTGWVISEEGAVLRTDNGGNSWYPQTLTNTLDLNQISINQSNDEFWLSNRVGAILKSNSGLGRWVVDGKDSDSNNIDQTNLPDWVAALFNQLNYSKKLSDEYKNISFNHIALNNGQLFLVGDGGNLLYSSDRGESWASIATNRSNDLQYIEFSPDERRGVIVGDNATVLYTNDAGQTWQGIQYSRTVAIWYWLLCLILLAASLWLLTRKPKASEDAEATVADLLASDKPLEPGDPDPLNFHGIALGLSRFMRNPSTEPPLTIAITGAWGSGKSSLMNLLYHDLKSYGFTPVWFNAWHHQKGEQLLASLYANIKSQAIPGWSKFYKLTPVGLSFRLHLLNKRIQKNWLITLVSLVIIAVVIRFIAENNLSWPDFYPSALVNTFFNQANGSFENLLILILGGPIAVLIRSLRAFGISPEKLIANKSNEKTDQKLDPSARQAFAKEFKEVSSCLDSGRMVIFIDDLDRCSKENVVDILEAMNFLSVSGDCYIVVGMDETWVKLCVENHFEEMKSVNKAGEKSFADHYLEKMINIPVPIPSLKEDDSINLLLPNPKHMSAGLAATTFLDSIKAFFQRFRTTTSLALMASLIALMVYYLPANLLLKSEEAKPEPQVLAEWNDIRVDYLSVDNGKPDINIDVAPDTASQDGEPEWRLVLQGQPGVLDEGIKLADLGDTASLLLKEANQELDNGQNNIALPPPSANANQYQEGTANVGEFVAVTTSSSLSDYWLPIIAVLFFLLSFIIYGLKIPNRFVEDSADFKEALSIWQSWISLQRSTPRAIKRYLNFVRYLAMRYKNPEPESKPSWFTTVFSNKPPVTSTIEKVIREENLVALSAIYAIEPSWLTNENLLAKLRSGDIHGMVIDQLGQTMTGADDQYFTALAEHLVASIERHKRRFGEAVFNDATVKQFLAINANNDFN